MSTSAAPVRRSWIIAGLIASSTSIVGLAPPAGAQLTIPLSVRSTVAGADADAHVRALGGLTSCHAFDCDQAASLGLELSPSAAWHLSGETTAGRHLFSNGEAAAHDRRIDLVYQRGGASLWFGAAGGEEQTPDSAPTGRPKWLEYGSMVRWRAVAVAVSLGSGTSMTLSAPTHYVKTTVYLKLDSALNLLRPDTVRQTVTDSGSTTRTAWTVAQLHLGWTGERWAAAAMAGRMSSRARGSSVWGGVEASRRVGRYVALVASAGTLPPRLAGDVAPHRAVVSLGLTATTAWLSGATPAPATVATGDGSPGFVARALADTRYRFVVRVADAQRVELASDCTAWQAVAMQRLDDALWFVDLIATPGAHQVSVRADGGAWHAPAGLTPMDDDFGGSAGAFVIP